MNRSFSTKGLSHSAVLDSSSPSTLVFDCSLLTMPVLKKLNDVVVLTLTDLESLCPPVLNWQPLPLSVKYLPRHGVYI